MESTTPDTAVVLGIFKEAMAKFTDNLQSLRGNGITSNNIRTVVAF
jgi:hypothetical protein